MAENYRYEDSYSGRDYIRDGQQEYDEEEEVSDEELTRRAQRCLQVANVALIFFSMGLMAIGFFTYEKSFHLTWSAAATAGVGAMVLAVTMCGLIGVFRLNPQMLRLFYTMMIFAAMALLVLGGFNLILIKQSKNAIKTNWDDIIADASTSERQSLDQAAIQSEVGRNMILCGLVCFFTLFIVLSVLGSVVQLVTHVTAYSIMLQSASITMLPFGVVLISAGLFIADTAATVEAPVTAFFIFIMGVIVMILSLMGCFGVTIESRGILKLYMYLMFLLSFAFLTFGVVAMVQADTLKQKLSDRWESIRRVLPPTFSGKYDKEQFEIFLEANLLLLGFLSICMGLLLAMQWYASMRLRSALKERNELIEDELEKAAAQGQSTDGLADMYMQGAPNRMQVLWKRQWTHGSKRSRRCIKCACCCVVLLFFLVIVVATLSLYFATSCASISKFSDEQPYATSSQLVYVNNNYTRGLTHVSLSPDILETDMGMLFTKGAFRSGLEADGWPELANQTIDDEQFVGITTDPKAKTKVMGFDISCQLADVEVMVPQASVYGGNSYSHSVSSPRLNFVTVSDRASIELDLTDVAFSVNPRFHSVTAKTTSGAIDVAGLLIGTHGLKLESDLGELTVLDSNLECNPDLLGEAEGNVNLRTDRGAVSVETVVSNNCDVYISGSAALINVDGLTMSADGGGSNLDVVGERGLVLMEDVTADRITVRSEQGSVRVKQLRVTDFLKMASETGSVEALEIDVAYRGGCQMETTSGSITLQLNNFVGILNIVTGGPVSCSGKGFTDPSDPCPVTVQGDQNHVKRAEVNCVGVDCSYAGTVTITSSSGTVDIVAYDPLDPEDSPAA